MSELTRVPSVLDMDDVTLIKHMELRHGEDLRVKRLGWEPQREERGEPPTLRGNGKVWRTFHNKMHELYDGRVIKGEDFYNHTHPEADDAD